jgi:tetratricopeptide (TPR) repeat protein
MSSANQQSDVIQGEPSSLAGGRYQVEAELGHGGMARVFRVVDQRSGQKVALKQLACAEELAPTLRAMLEREYHTLVQLEHPRIVRAFDYGLDAGGAYYTMELLEGRNAREALKAGEIAVTAVCQLLRDAASALALIHSRRLVHRDVSPRNLWCTPDGHGKLIDFGTLVAMGPQTRVAGTPAFVPPEAVYLQPLDARCDLYALGALAYFLLTKRNAYPAREIAELRDRWQHRPPPPEALRPDVPRALSDLVMALLSLDTRGRPSSAAEVVERLSGIASLPAEDEHRYAQAFLASPKLVGRNRESAALRKPLLRALGGRGGAAAIVAPGGFGRSRMLVSLVLEAKLLGAATVLVDATAVDSDRLGVAAALVERVLETLPMTPALAVDLAPILSHVSPALHRAFGSPALAELSPLERPGKIGAALLSLFEIASRDHGLVLAVDNVHRADAASLGVLARLALRISERHLLLLTSCDQAALAHAPPALEQLVQPASRIELPALEPAHTHELLDSLFGGVPGLDAAAGWLHELSLGSPQSCMQYAQFLVDRGIARYDGGQWHLPENLRAHGLPSTLGAMFEARAAALSPDAHALALGLALARDESRSAWQPETHVRLDAFPKLLGDGADGLRTFTALDELLHEGVVQQRDTHYVLAQRAMVDALLRTTDEAERKRAHLRVADVFDDSYLGRIRCARELQRAGEDRGACELLVEAANERQRSGVYDFGGMRLSLIAECTLRALEYWQANAGTPLDGIVLRRILALSCSIYDWGLIEVADAHLLQLCRDSGMAFFAETDASQPDLQRVIECLKRAQQKYEATPATERGLPPGDAVRDLVACAMPLASALCHIHDATRLRTLRELIMPLRSLAPVLDTLIEFCVLSGDRATGREIGDRQLLQVERLLAAHEVHEILRRGGAAVYSHIQAVDDTRRGDPRALESMTRMVEAGMSEDMFLVVHGRWLGHAFRGDAAAAQRFYKQVEAITEDDVWRRKAFLFVEAQLFALIGDLAGLKRVAEAIGDLAPRFPGWRPWLAFTRAAMHRLRGELEAARAELDLALSEARPGEHRAFIVAAPAHAELLLQIGDAEGGLREAEGILEQVRALSLDASAEVAAERIRALCENALGRSEAARASIERAIARAVELGFGGLPLAQLHEAHARIWLDAGEAEQCREELDELYRAIEHADAPALVTAYEALREESSRKLSLSNLPAFLTSIRPSGDSSIATSDVATRLSAAGGRAKRARQALELLLEDIGARSGYLFLCSHAGLSVAAAVEEIDPEEDVLPIACRYLDGELGETMTETVSASALTSAGPTLPTVSTQSGSPYLPVLLADRRDLQATLVGVALIAVTDLSTRTPRVDLVRAVSHGLRFAGDSIGRDPEPAGDS